MADTLHKVTATNITDGPKILNSAPPVVLQGGAGTDGQVEITDAELKSMRGTGYFKIIGGSASAADDPDDDLIRAAIEGLDPKNDEHWTQAGLPEVAAVKAALGADVNRKQIEAAAPDAKRPTA